MIYLDLILSKKTIKKADLQLVGVTSLKIAEYKIFYWLVYIMKNQKNILNKKIVPRIHILLLMNTMQIKL